MSKTKKEKRKSLYTESFSSALSDRKDPRLFIQRVAKLLGNHGNTLIQWAKPMDNDELSNYIENILSGGCSDEWIFLHCSTGGTSSSEILPPGTPGSGRRSNIGINAGSSGNDIQETKERFERPIGKEVEALINRMVKDITSSVLSHTGGVYLLKGTSMSGKTTILSEIISRLKTEYAITPSNWRTVHTPGNALPGGLQMLYMDDADLESFEKPVENLVVKYYRNSKNVILFTCKDSSKFQGLLDSCSGKVYNMPSVTDKEVVTILSKYVVRKMKINLKTSDRIVNIMNTLGTQDKIQKGIEVIRDLLYTRIVEEYKQNGDIPRENVIECNYTPDEIKESISHVMGITILPSYECTHESIRHKFSKIKGQDETIDMIVPLMSTIASGLSDPARPAGVIFMYGPPGTGKTEIGKVMANEFMDGIIHVEDMNTYSEKHSVSRLTGAPPGYLGYNDPPAIIEFIDKHKRGVLILNEIEKAHETVTDHILELIDTGFLPDTKGVRHDARKFIILMTSNVTYGKKYESKKIGFGNTSGGKEKIHDFREDLKASGCFKNEFISRLQVISRLNDLTKNSISAIADDMLNDLELRLSSVGIKTSKKLRKILLNDIQVKFESNHGAREMRTYIETVIKDRILAKARK